MFTVFRHLTKQQFAKEVPDSSKQVCQWFQDNQDRDDCKVQLWYGRVHTIKRKGVAEQIKAIADAHIAAGEYLKEDKNCKMKGENNE
jgi:hypothetical protein